MKTLDFRLSHEYEYHIGKGLIDNAGEPAAKICARAMLVTDSTVGSLYSAALRSSLERSKISVCEMRFPDGEAAKSAENYFSILSGLAECGFTKSDAVIGLGGGSICDIAGFAAATYMRSCRLILMPTTLLCAVDASIGGKNAIDLPGGKNLAGTIYQPHLVMCDTGALATLDKRAVFCGMAEVIKAAFIADSKLFDALLSADINNPRMLEDIIYLSAKIKRDIVMSDEFDGGGRRLLNFGHTAGHAAEALSGYTIPHGEAVAAGMAVMTRAAVHFGYCRGDVYLKLKSLLDKYSLPDSFDFSPRELARAALADKKRSGGDICLVMPERIGSCALRTVSFDELEGIFEAGADK